jgi:hypothetical protein
LQAVSGFGRGWQNAEDEPRYIRSPYFPPKGKSLLDYVDKKDWGPIPLGYYRVRRPGYDPVLGRCARLDPSAGPIPYSREGFYIHGRAAHKYHGQFHEHASHGCIVPKDAQRLDDLMDALERVQAKSTGTYVAMLHVIN